MTMHPMMVPLRPRTWMPVKRGRPSSPNSFAVASPNLSPASPQPASLVRPAWPIEKLDERTLFPSLHVSFQIIGGEKSPHVATLRSWHHWQFVLCPPGRRAAARSRPVGHLPRLQGSKFPRGLPTSGLQPRLCRYIPFHDSLFYRHRRSYIHRKSQPMWT